MKRQVTATPAEASSGRRSGVASGAMASGGKGAPGASGTLVGGRGCRRRGRLLAAALLAALTGASGPAVAAAQSGGDGFLFKSPRLTLSWRGGIHLPRAASGDGVQSVWDLTREELTVENSDLTGTSVVGEIALRASDRIDVTLALGHSSTETRSEFRDWVGADDLPIEQTTAFSTTPLTVGIKGYLVPRGRSVGTLAWIPNRVLPYLGIAGGVVGYEFHQYGEFVDYETYDIFRDDYLSSGRAATLHFTGGVDIGINRHFLLTTEAKYSLASAPLDTDFVGFPDLDMAGFQVTAGFALRF